jgi:hypothetical protein
MNGTPLSPRTPDLSLTCRTQDLERFVAMGLVPLRARGAVTDLELAVADRDLYPERCLIAEAGIPFYGHAMTSIDRVPVVFAAHSGEHFEAPAGSGHHPAANLLTDARPNGSQLLLGRLYYRCLAGALGALPDPKPWLPAMPQVLTDAMACECGGRGWFLAEEEDTNRFFICRCDLCAQFETDQLAGMIAYGSVEAGWPL